MIGDLSSIQETRGIADQVNRLGQFDAVIHNAGIGYRENRRGSTVDGLPNVFAVNALPGWVATRMGGPGARDDLEAGPKTQVWLATSDSKEARVTGGYFYHEKPRTPNPEASRSTVQDRFLEECARLSGVKLPTS